jgi:hypothetical protein
MSTTVVAAASHTIRVFRGKSLFYFICFSPKLEDGVKQTLRIRNSHRKSYDHENVIIHLVLENWNDFIKEGSRDNRVS